MKGKIIDYLFVRNGKGRITVDVEEDFRKKWEDLHDRDVDIIIKRYSEPRTLKANAYLWTLITEIGNRLRIDKEDVYVDMLKHYGQGGSVSVQEDYALRFERTNKYTEFLGMSELNGKNWWHYRFWVGSHEYNREEFSILLDGVIQEAKQLGIEIRPKEEIDSMLDAWEGRQDG